MNQVKTIAPGQGIDDGSKLFVTQRQSGFALIVSLLILVVLTLIAVAGLRSSVVEEMVSGNQRLAASALFGSEQGVSQALENLFSGNINDTGFEDDPTWSEDGSVGGPGYSASYTVSHLVRNASQVEDDDGRRYFIIESTGNTTTGEAERSLEVAVALEWGDNSNVAGLIGCQGITGDGNVTTGSYSSSGQSSDGDRGDMATTDDEAFLYLDGSSDMDVVGEIRSTGAIYMKSDALVRRDASANLQIKVESGDIFGSAYTNDDYHGDEDSVHGDIYQHYHINPLVQGDCDPLNIDNVFGVAPDIQANHNGDLGIGPGGNFNGSPDDIDPGDYWFNNVTIEDNTINGNVRMYVTGNFTLDSDAELVLAPGASLEIYMESGRFVMDSNSGANRGGTPLNMQIYSRAVDTVKDDKDWEDDEPDTWDDGNQKIVINSNSQLWGIIYAPRAHVWLDSNVRVHGSVRGRFVDILSNFHFTYDEDLDTFIAGNPTDYKLVYWTELYPE